MKEYDLYIPLRYNDGLPIEPEKLRDLKERLLARFGGLTYFPQVNEGLWRVGEVVFRDEIVVFRVLSEDTRAARDFLRHLKDDLKRELRQEEILIVEREARVL